jgi:hypothetical protein
VITKALAKRFERGFHGDSEFAQLFGVAYTGVHQDA